MAKKILIATGVYPPEVGGPATYTALLEKEMPKRGIEVSVLPFRVVRELPKVVRHIAFLFKVLALGRKADLLYAQDPVSVGFPTMLAAKILNKPFLIRVAGDWVWEQSAQRFGVKDSIDDFQNKKYGFKIEFLRAIQKMTVRHANCAITPSKYFRNLVSGWNPKKENVMTIYNGINFGEIAENDGKFEPKTIFSAGRLVPWKGFDILIEIVKKMPGWKLFIAGDGPDREKLSKLIEEGGLKEKAFMLGDIERREMIKKIQNSEIFILNTSFESFSFVIVEAMFAGTPVISTDIGNISEIIENGKEGILVNPGDKVAIIGAVQKLSDPEFRNQIVKNAVLKAKTFSIDSTLEKTAEVIFSLTKK